MHSRVNSNRTDEDYYKGSMETAVETSVIDLLREREALTPDSTKISFIMVGVSAQERLSTALRLRQFLAWRGAEIEVFQLDEKSNNVSSFVDGVLQWMRDGGEIAIVDGENGSEQARQELVRTFKAVQGLWFQSMGVVFIEVIPPHLKIDASEHRLSPKSKLQGLKRPSSVPSFTNATLPQTVTYESIPVTAKYSFLKLYNTKSKVMASRVYGRITKSILPFLMATSHRKTRPVWLVRAGWATDPNYDQKGHVICEAEPKRGADLREAGHEFASWLSEFVERRIGKKSTEPLAGDIRPRLIDGRSDKKLNRIKIMTSTLNRAAQTAEKVKWAGSIEQYAALNPLDKGLFPGLKFLNAEEKAPEFFRRWIKDKYNTRFPAGESYHDVRVRLESCLIEIEQQSSPVLVIAHGTVLQVLHCYFTGKAIEDCWKVSFPHDTVMEYTPNLSGARGQWNIRSYPMNTNSTRTRPQAPSQHPRLRQPPPKTPPKRPKGVQIAIDFPALDIDDSSNGFVWMAVSLAVAACGVAAWTILRKSGSRQGGGGGG